MKKILSIAKISPLMNGITETDLPLLLNCLSPQRKKVQKGEYLFFAGDTDIPVGMVLSGSVHIVRDDFWGNRSILAQIGEGGIFAESFACVQNTPAGVNAIVNEDGEILLLDLKRVLQSCSQCCSFHQQLIQNLLTIVATKNINLTKKIQHLSHRTTKEKVLSYLSQESNRSHSPSFTIPFNRQQMADYLGVDRSALSAELSKLQSEGILSYHKNQFTLHHNHPDT